MYYLTVEQNGVEVVRRKVFDDYGTAVKFISKYFEPKSRRSVLSFTTEAINGEFARSYVEMADPTTIDHHDQTRYLRSVKFSNAFSYEGSYFFLIESDVGIQDADNDNGN
jgi:hypothetical protein